MCNLYRVAAHVSKAWPGDTSLVIETAEPRPMMRGFPRHATSKRTVPPCTMAPQCTNLRERGAFRISGVGPDKNGSGRLAADKVKAVPGRSQRSCRERQRSGWAGIL